MDPFLTRFFPDVYAKEHNIKASTNQYCKFNNQTLTLFTSSLYVAALVASLGCSPLTRLFGRRLTMFSGGVLFLAGATMNGFAQKVWMLIVGRLLLGFGIGCSNQVSFGATASLMSAMITGGCNVLATIVSIATVDKFGRRTMFLEGGVQMFICQFLPETKGIPIEEMAVVWQNHSYWKNFVKPAEMENIGEEQA
ncbi:hypothetical protein TSUD_303240 [Trifolium subterraneum]|uniref:Major facilitator superfamily (MFS) profile domain-containing protein n=1 Tax=Trifolium subterraneum TaxID=3900 RepID=A0A2Z6NWX0_TRISU|nr:hypothetical protein TSUD_303240 [Trifolium subterraneum]